MSILCTLLGHDWWQWPEGSPHIATYPTPIGECRRCEAVEWVFDNGNSKGPHDKVFPAGFQKDTGLGR
jgi:hypothetical protein